MPKTQKYKNKNYILREIRFTFNFTLTTGKYIFKSILKKVKEKLKHFLNVLGTLNTLFSSHSIHDLLKYPRESKKINI